MTRLRRWSVVFAALSFCCMVRGVVRAQPAALPTGVKVEWDLAKAQRETTPTRERVCINGLWRWQPVTRAADSVPADNWGWFKVPGPWPGAQHYMARESQRWYPHPSWRRMDARALGAVTRAWYQREIVVPAAWADRRITLATHTLNSYATVYIDGRKVGEIVFPGGEVDLTGACRPGAKHVLSVLVEARSMKDILARFPTRSTPREGRMIWRGPCGDVFLESTPRAARIDDVKVDTSVRNRRLALDVALDGLAPDAKYRLRAQVRDGARPVKTLTSGAFAAGDLTRGRFAFADAWKPVKLWDLHTPGNVYEVQVSLVDADGKVRDVFRSVRFGFREFRVDGRDLRLNGTRIHLMATPLDAAHVSTALASYAGAKDLLLRMKRLGVNAVYTHNYSCLPGVHLAFDEILRAADDVGMLVSFSLPHPRTYTWPRNADDAEDTNGFAVHVERYVRYAQNHPSVVMYSMSHNGTAYGSDQDPDRIDGVYSPWPDPKGKPGDRSDANARLSRRVEAVVHRFDTTRPIYHHSSGSNGQFYTLNCYLDFVPIQERAEWFAHWSTKGVKPLYLV